MLKKTCKRRMKNDLIGMTTWLFSHNGDESGKRWSRNFRYSMKRSMGLQGKGLGWRIIEFPQRNLSALWLGKKNWRNCLWLRQCTLCQILRVTKLHVSNQVSLPKHMRAKKLSTKEQIVVCVLCEYMSHTMVRSAIVRLVFAQWTSHKHLHPCKVQCTRGNFWSVEHQESRVWSGGIYPSR